MSGHVESSFVIDDFQPSYLSLTERQLAQRVVAAQRHLQDCCVCPRECHVNRLEGQLGICRSGQSACVASAFAHHGEETCFPQINRRPLVDEILQAHAAGRLAGLSRFA